MLRIRTVRERTTKGDELSIGTDELLDSVLPSCVLHEHVINFRNLSTLVTLNSLIEVETKAIFDIPPRIEHRSRVIAGMELIIFQLPYVIGNLPARISLAQDAAGIMEQKKDSEGNGDYGRPKQHPRTSPTHREEDEAKNTDADNGRVG